MGKIRMCSILSMADVLTRIDVLVNQSTSQTTLPSLSSNSTERIQCNFSIHQLYWFPPFKRRVKIEHNHQLLVVSQLSITNTTRDHFVLVRLVQVLWVLTYQQYRIVLTSCCYMGKTEPQTQHVYV